MRTRFSLKPYWTVLISAALAITASLSVWLHAQTVDARPIPSLMPPGALLYLEAKDFSSLLGSWNRSAEKRRWLASTNYQTLSLSRLVQRLSQAEDEFAAIAGMPIGMNLADQVAGTRSGFAFYGLSSLSFVYITQLPATRIETTSLWRSRTRYQSREVAGISFYVKSNDEGKRTVAFASYKDWFVVSTDEGRMADTLVLLSGVKAASLANEPWFAQAGEQAPTQGDLRLVYNLQSLLRTPQFRTYWIQRNASELKPFSAGISDLLDTQAGFEERRTLLRTTATPIRTPESLLAEVLAYAPVNDAFYRAWSMPDTPQLSDTLQQVILGERPTTNVYNAPAPEINPEAGAVGSEADLEIRIDEPGFNRSPEPSLTPLVNALVAMQPTALLHLQTTTVLRDQVFVKPDSSVVVICKEPNRAALDRALAQIPAIRTGALDNLRVSADGHAIILSRISSNSNLPRTVSAPSLAPEATYTAVYNHRVEWPHYKKLFDVLNTHAASPEMAESSSAPPFFSGNLQSLGDTLSRLNSVSLISADRGAVVRETVRYELAKP